MGLNVNEAVISRDDGTDERPGTSKEDMIRLYCLLENERRVLKDEMHRLALENDALKKIKENQEKIMLKKQLKKKIEETREPIKQVSIITKKVYQADDQMRALEDEKHRLALVQEAIEKITKENPEKNRLKKKLKNKLEEPIKQVSSITEVYQADHERVMKQKTNDNQEKIQLKAPESKRMDDFCKHELQSAEYWFMVDDLFPQQTLMSEISDALERLRSPKTPSEDQETWALMRDSDTSEEICTNLITKTLLNNVNGEH